MNRKTLFAGILGIAVIGVSAVSGYFYGYSKNSLKSTTAAPSDRPVLYWIDPMVPGFRSDKPGKSPFMDMELVPVYADESGSEGPAVVTVRPEFLQSFGVRTHKVTKGGSPRTVTGQGYLFRDGEKLQILLDLFERDVAWVRVGLPAEIKIPDFPGRHWSGTVEHVNADVDVGTRSLQVRVRLATSDPQLKSNHFAEVIIRDRRPADSKVRIPREALIRTGSRTAVVLALGSGRFQPVEVVPGEESGDWVEILRGVQEDDSVVTSGQFLIDSEANVRASFQRMEPTPGDAPTNRTEQKP